MHTKARLTVGIVVLLLTLGGLYSVRYLHVVETPALPNETACTLEAKVCPDGSSVGRTGPSCSFAPCPVPKKTPKTPASVSVSATTTTALVTTAALPWKTYTNEHFGFSIDYPANATSATTFQARHHTSTAWSQKGVVGDGSPVITLSLPDVTTKIEGKTERLLVGELRIGQSEDTKDLDACLRPDSNSQEVGEQTIGGEKMQVFIISSAGMSQFAVGKSYRLLREGACLAFEPIIAGVTPGPLAANEAEYKRLSALETAAVKEMEQIFETMMTSLRFSTTTLPMATTTPEA